MILAEDPSERLFLLALGNRLIKKIHIFIIKGPTSNKTQIGSQLTVTVEDFPFSFVALLTTPNS